ncbi:MAG: hypothetical protein RQ866_08785, partial [Bacteroidales bacterium]|nr:hypothetical protein [Bacteroidales bacterium]
MDIPKMAAGEDAGFVKRINSMLKFIGTTLLVGTSDHFKTPVEEQLVIQKAISSQQTTPLQDKRGQAPLKSHRSVLLFNEIKCIDEGFKTINSSLTDKVFSDLSGTYNAIYALLKDIEIKKHDNSVIDFFIEAKKLIDDSLPAGIAEVSETIIKATNSYLRNAKRLIFKTPVILRLAYENNDPNVKNKKPRKVLLLKTAKRSFNTMFMPSFPQHLSSIGVAGMEINNCFINWINSLDGKLPLELKSLRSSLDLVYTRLNNRFLESLNTLSREMCNKIFDDADHVKKTSFGNKYKSSAFKQGIKHISLYAKKWNRNQQLLANHLHLQMQMKILQLQTSMNISNATQSIEHKITDDSLNAIDRFIKIKDSISIAEAAAIENKLFEIANMVDADALFREIFAGFEKQIEHIDDGIELITIEALRDYEEQQHNITPSFYKVRKIMHRLIENRIMAEVKKTYQESVNALRLECGKAENSIMLVRLTLSDSVSSKKQRLLVMEKTLTQLHEFVENIKTLNAMMHADIEAVLNHLNQVLDVTIFVDMADDYAYLSQKMGTNKVALFFKKSTGKVVDMLDRIIMISRERLIESDYLHKVKSTTNPHTKFADFIDTVSLSAIAVKKLPFYYFHMFTSKHAAPIVPVETRKAELEEAGKAIQRFVDGKSGAILFTGEHLSGKSYLMHNAINLYANNNVIAVAPP